MWDLAGRLTGQLRTGGRAVLGYDMTAALALAGALGIEPLAVAEMLPAIEASMVRAMRRASEDQSLAPISASTEAL